MLPLKANGGVDVLVGLEEVKSRPSTMVSARPRLQPLPVVVQQRMVRPGDRRARGEQDQRVDERQMPRGRAPRCPPAANGRRWLRRARTARPRRGRGCVEEGPEPGDEEHHLRGDEHDHAVAQVRAARRGVWSPCVRFLDRRPPTRRTWCRARRGQPGASSQKPDAAPCMHERSRRAPARRPRRRR